MGVSAWVGRSIIVLVLVVVLEKAVRCPGVWNVPTRCRLIPTSGKKQRLFEDDDEDEYDWSLGLVSEVLEIQRYAKIFPSQELNDGLQVILLLPGDSDLAVLQLALHIQSFCLDRLGDLLGLIAFEALFNMNFLAGMPQRRDGWVLALHITQIDPALSQLPNHDLHQRPQSGCILGR